MAGLLRNRISRFRIHIISADELAVDDVVSMDHFATDAKVSATQPAWVQDTLSSIAPLLTQWLLVPTVAFARTVEELWGFTARHAVACGAAQDAATGGSTAGSTTISLPAEPLRTYGDLGKAYPTSLILYGNMSLGPAWAQAAPEVADAGQKRACLPLVADLAFLGNPLDVPVLDLSTPGGCGCSRVYGINACTHFCLSFTGLNPACLMHN